MSKTANTTRDAARQHPLNVTLDGQTVVIEPRTFSTGSQGWNVNQKVLLVIGGTAVEAMFQGNIVINNSKALPMDDVATAQVEKSKAKKASAA